MLSRNIDQSQNNEKPLFIRRYQVSKSSMVKESKYIVFCELEDKALIFNLRLGKYYGRNSFVLRI